MKITVCGLTITSSWGNGHATTFRALLSALARRGHAITFLEHDKPWYAGNRDLPVPSFCRTILYQRVEDLSGAHRSVIAEADVVIIGSYVPEGVQAAQAILAAAQGPVCFYDIDTPVTLARVAAGDCEYLIPELIPRFATYFSFTGGDLLEELETRWQARAARALYCTVDPEAYRPQDTAPDLALGYLGTYSPDRQPTLARLLLQPARTLSRMNFAVAGPQYPADIDWPGNVARFEHLPPDAHPGFYARQRYTLNVTRADMVRTGYAPSVRLFEAAACGTPIVSDRWRGIETFFTPGREIHLADGTDDVLAILARDDEAERQAMAEAARARVLQSHTADVRAAELEAELLGL